MRPPFGDVWGVGMCGMRGMETRCFLKVAGMMMVAETYRNLSNKKIRWWSHPTRLGVNSYYPWLLGIIKLPVQEIPGFSWETIMCSFCFGFTSTSTSKKKSGTFLQWHLAFILYNFSWNQQFLLGNSPGSCSPMVVRETFEFFESW